MSAPNLSAATVADLKTMALSTEPDAPELAKAAYLELHERAEAGDSSSKRAIVAIDKAQAEEPEAEEGTPSLTLPGVANAIHDELARIALTAWPPTSLDEAQGFAALAGAFRDVDAVLARVRAEGPRDVGPAAEAFLSAVWDEAQKAGLEISQADVLVGRLRARIAPE